MEKSNSFRLKVWGENACFTRPEMKVERVSYDIMTPSAARGIMEAILWKPAIHWEILQIDVLNPIRWESVRRNEVGAVIPINSIKSAMKNKTGKLGIYIEKERQQRAGLLLRDVSYVIHARFKMTEKKGNEDSVVKFEQMFIRRASQGQCFHRPYFGCREFPVNFEFMPRDKEKIPTIDESRDLGWMLFDIDFSKKEPIPQFFQANMKMGTIDLRTVEVRS